MAARTCVRGVVSLLRFAAANVAAVGANPQVECAATLFAVLRARFGKLVCHVSALSLGSGEEFHVDLCETSDVSSIGAIGHARP